MKTLSTHGAMLSPYNIQYAVSNCGLKWKMHPAQWTSMQYWVYNDISTIIKTVEKETTVQFNRRPENTLLGIPVEISQGVYQGHVELYLGEELIFRIENLAIPMGFE